MELLYRPTDNQVCDPQLVVAEVDRIKESSDGEAKVIDGSSTMVPSGWEYSQLMGNPDERKLVES